MENEDKCDEDLMFLKSLLPDLKSPPRAQKIRTKIQLQEVLYNAITAVEPTVSTHTFTTPAIINFRWRKHSLTTMASSRTRSAVRKLTMGEI